MFAVRPASSSGMGKEKRLTPVESKVITEAELKAYLEAKYRVTTVIPLVKNSTRNVYLLDHESLESFFEGYEEFAEFVIGIEPVRDPAANHSVSTAG